MDSPAAAYPNDELAKAHDERDLYRRLLDLGNEDEPGPFLAEALALIVKVSDAECGYVEITRGSSPSQTPRWSIGHGCSDEAVLAIRERLSQGVIAEAIVTGQTIVTACALDDPRFKELGSVRRNRIEAVLCAPVGARAPMGVIYLQGQLKSGFFSEEDRRRAEVFAQHLAPLADRLLMHEERREQQDPTAELRASMNVSGMVGRSEAFAKVLREVRTAAPRDVVVLLTGPTGAGKTDVARMIHENSPRRHGPFVELSCTSVPEALFENELFGAMAGGHATATRRIEGKVAAANGGTLFLDEIGELSLSSQGKLLQLLQSKRYYALGAPHPSRADVRVIAATNVDLKAAVQERQFREDLYYRLDGFSIRVPPLAERREDVAELAALFCSRACDLEDLPILRLSPGAILALEAAEWPGNIRQLASRVKEAVLRAHTDASPVVEADHVFRDATPGSESRVARPSLQAAMRRYQAQYVLEVLEECGWNTTVAAERMDIAKSHVYNLIKAHGLKKPIAGALTGGAPSSR